MNDQSADISSADAKLDEIVRLRREVERLEQQVARLDRLAHEDSLIDLPNRRGFMRRLEHLVARVHRYGDCAAMLYVDIDGLKAINDGFGHKAGDEALIHIAEMLSNGVRKSDFVARLGGDEFGILLERADEPGAHETGDRLVTAIAGADFAYEGQPLPLSVAIGVAMINAGDDPDAVMARADAAMYRGKARD